MLENDLSQYKEEIDITTLKNECRLKALNLKTVLDNSVHESPVEQSALESRYNNLKVAVLIYDLRDYEVIILTKIDLYSLKFFETKGSHFS